MSNDQSFANVRSLSLSPTTKFMLLIWVVLGGGTWLVMTWMKDSPVSALSPSDNKSKSSWRDGPDALMVPEKRARIADSVEDSEDSEFRRAVHAEALALVNQISSTQKRLQALKASHATWETKAPSLLKGELGRRIAASEPHFKLVADSIDSLDFSSDVLLDWDVQLVTLAKQFQAAGDATYIKSNLEERTKLHEELSKKIEVAISAFDKRETMLEIATRETKNVPPGKATFEERLHEEKLAKEKAHAEALLVARGAARKAAEEDQIKRIAAQEQQIVQAETERRERMLQAEKDKIESLARAEQEQREEEARVKEAERRATIAGLKVKAEGLDKDVQQAKLEREYAQDLPKIKSYLSAFISEGYSLRSDGTKGPVSLAYIKGQGAMESTRDGIAKLVNLAHESRDRPRGPIPYITFFNAGQTSMEPMETAQALLTKYGDLMVTKGLLAP